MWQRFSGGTVHVFTLVIVILSFKSFSAHIFHQTFTSLAHIQPEVLYPIPDFSAFEKPIDLPSDDLLPRDKEAIFLSINRYERKKNLFLAILSFGMFYRNVFICFLLLLTLILHNLNFIGILLKKYIRVIPRQRNGQIEIVFDK